MGKDEMINFIYSKMNCCHYDSYSDTDEMYPVFIGTILEYCKDNGINAAIGSTGKLIGNKDKEGSYFEIQFNDLRDALTEQNIKCIKGIYNLLK